MLDHIRIYRSFDIGFDHDQGHHHGIDFFDISEVDLDPGFLYDLHSIARRLFSTIAVNYYFWRDTECLI